MQAKDIDTDRIVELVRACNEGRCAGGEGWHGGAPGYGAGEHDPPQGHWANRWDLARALGEDVPEKVLLAKLDKMIRRGTIEGCACGCRGDFEVYRGAAHAVASD